jgi:hypothetical protein
LVDPRARKSGTSFSQSSFDRFAGNDERQEDGFAWTFVVGGQARQPIAAVNQFFNL